ncbi:hypothetical protein FHX74_002092 [Friedmanniella endophytica]|uniref:Uncharacterized protein n=1 Tax=Microlunatus kandeliicorticis TaxID=1759536 RepID=A0A7W3P614_9ACTN|nr:hypothetical protein [Microlunatus kandeliicorticis]MBA8794473.1 hypothetical protein [Microlunatus kandeliicorticis]
MTDRYALIVLALAAPEDRAPATSEEADPSRVSTLVRWRAADHDHPEPSAPVPTATP